MLDLRNLAPFTPYPFEGETADCNLCGAEGGRIVARWDRRLKRLRTVCCEHCGLVRTDPMPSDAELDRYYGGAYRQDYQMATATPPKRHLVKSLKDAQRRLDRFAAHLNPGARVLDFGCGSGEFVHLAGQAGYSAVGIEPGRAYAEFARAEYGIDVVCAPYGEAGLTKASFDLITINHVLEHLRDPVGALQVMAGWLKPDGVLFVSVPDVTASKRPTFERLHFAHVFNFCPETLAMAAAKAGLEPDPRFPAEGTTQVFRRAPALAQVAVPAGLAGRVMLALPDVSPLQHLVSGAWMGSTVRKARRWLDEGRTVKPKPVA